jgi:hypothetical protein
MAAPISFKEVNPADLPLEGIDQAPELFIDGYFGAAVGNGVAKIHFHTTKFDPTTQKMKRFVVFTMVAPIANIAQIAGALGELVDSFKRDGLLVEMSPAQEKADA